jgi:hypothetical protein
VGGSSVRRVGAGQDDRRARREGGRGFSSALVAHRAMTYRPEGTDPPHPRSKLNQSACVAAPGRATTKAGRHLRRDGQHFPEILAGIEEQYGDARRLAWTETPVNSVRRAVP